MAMLNVDIDLTNKKKKPKIKVEGEANTLMNEIMEFNVYTIDFILSQSSISVKEKLDCIKSFTDDLKENLIKTLNIGGEYNGNS